MDVAQAAKGTPSLVQQPQLSTTGMTETQASGGFD